MYRIVSTPSHLQFLLNSPLLASPVLIACRIASLTNHRLRCPACSVARHSFITTTSLLDFVFAFQSVLLFEPLFEPLLDFAYSVAIHSNRPTTARIPPLHSVRTHGSHPAESIIPSCLGLLFDQLTKLRRGVSVLASRRRPVSRARRFDCRTE